MIQAKETLNSEYDKAAKARSFVEGDMVLLRILGLALKLEDSLDGPYEVFRKCNMVNYELASLTESLNARWCTLITLNIGYHNKPSCVQNSCCHRGRQGTGDEAQARRCC